MKILIADASASFRKSLGERLGAVPGAVVVSEAEHEVQVVLWTAFCAPDVVLADVELRTGTGFAALERLRSSGFSGAAYVVSAGDESVLGPQCLRAGFDGYYDKSHDLDRLVAALTVYADAPRAFQRQRILLSATAY